MDAKDIRRRIYDLLYIRNKCQALMIYGDIYDDACKVCAGLSLHLTCKFYWDIWIQSHGKYHHYLYMRVHDERNLNNKRLYNSSSTDYLKWGSIILKKTQDSTDVCSKYANESPVPNYMVTIKYTRGQYIFVLKKIDPFDDIACNMEILSMQFVNDMCQLILSKLPYKIIVMKAAVTGRMFIYPTQYVTYRGNTANVINDQHSIALLFILSNGLDIGAIFDIELRSHSYMAVQVVIKATDHM